MMWSLLPVFHLQRGGSDGDALARDVVEHVDLVGETAAREDLEDVERFLERAARRPLLHHALPVRALEPQGSGGPPDASGRGGGGISEPGRDGRLDDCRHAPCLPGPRGAGPEHGGLLEYQESPAKTRGRRRIGSSPPAWPTRGGGVARWSHASS